MNSNTPFETAFQPSIETVPIPGINTGQSNKIVSWLKTPVGISLAAFVIVFIALLIVNPPVTRKCTDNLSAPSPDLSKILLISGIAGLAVLIGPYAVKYFGQ